MSWQVQLRSTIQGLPRPWRIALAATALPLVGVATALVLWRVRDAVFERRLERKRERKRKSCRKAVDGMRRRVSRSEEKLGRSEIERITHLTLDDLATQLRQRHLSAANALIAYQSKAIEAHDRTNCLVEPVNEAEEWAAERDELSSPDGLLHGVPVSIKEYFGIKGYDGSLGLISRLDKPYADDSVLVKVLKMQGAVPFVKTNLPHMAISYTTMNPIFGTTLNPVDPTRGPGGSSGGESALIALHGSPLGWGSDIGGSIRNPCHFCGLVGLKPTGNRISTKGTYTVDATNNCLPIVLGPMARDVDSVVLAMKAVLVPYMFELDRSVPPLPFNEQVYTDSRPLRIGYYLDNGLFEPVPSCKRAVLLAKDILANGKKHTLIEWKIPKEIAELADALNTKGKLLFADQGKTVLEVLEGDRAYDNIADFEKLLKMPIIVRRLLKWILKSQDKEMSEYLHYACGMRGGIAEWWKTIEEVQDLRRSFEAAWDEAQLDALICPAFSCPAMPIEEIIPHRGEGSDLQIYNVFDVPAGVVPVTKVTKDDVTQMEKYPECNEAYIAIKKGMTGAEGLPVGVQVVTARWQEELCLRIMKEIESSITSGS